MNKLKFRAWNKRLEQMYQVYQLDFDNGLVMCKSDTGTKHTFGMIDIEITQFTGKKDKEFNEIFEGHIVKNTTFKRNYDDRNGKYEYHDDKTETIFPVCFDEHWCHFKFTQRVDTGILEIIGNIHQNKNLLESEND